MSRSREGDGVRDIMGVGMGGGKTRGRSRGLEEEGCRQGASNRHAYWNSTK